MGKIILTSNGIDSNEIYNLFKSFIKDDFKIAIITTAKDEKENANGPQKAKRIFLKMGAKTIDFIDLEYDDPKLLFQYNLVYLDGGSPFRLMYWIRQSKSEGVFKKLLKENTFIAGRSAGSMVCGENFSICNYLTPEMNTLKITDFTGMGLCKINICPHCNNFPKMYENCENKLLECQSDNDIFITKLNDGQAILIDNSTVTKIEGKVLEM